MIRSLEADPRISPCVSCSRRALLAGAISFALLPRGASGDALAAVVGDPAKLRPQVGDRLVHASGGRVGRPIGVDELLPAAAPVTAWPMAVDTQTVRDGSRLNLVNLLRFDPAALSPRTQENAAAGIVAFAAMCSHAGCEITGFSAETHHLVCPCHGSEFDVLDAAAVAKGPATKPLAMLPLKVEDGALLVARAFTHQVGFKPA
jgi:rieske iron-sulfur protein